MMGLANLVPGVSGGTMILVVGLYDEFIASLADATRLRFNRRNVMFLGIVAFSAGIAIVTFAGTLSRAVTLHRSAMFALFIGLTLGGVPLLLRMLKRFTFRAGIGLAIGLALMILIATTREEPPDKSAIREAVAAGALPITPGYAKDLAAGALGMSAMVLPGVSGAYMLLILNRYEAILSSIAVAKDFLVSAGEKGDPAFLHVLIPVAIGATLGLVLLSNFLRWMLQRHKPLTLGLLLGILLGSVIGIWPFEADSRLVDYLFGVGLAAAGFACTTLLSRISA